jgi:hypothetical protein
MTPLRAMLNIGSVCAAELESAGIASGEALQSLGSVGAALRLRAAGYGVCRSKLAGLEGAIRGVKWNLVPRADREALWDELAGYTD